MIASSSADSGSGGRRRKSTPIVTKIVVAQNAGYCYGVERALKIAEGAVDASQGPIVTLGPLIHNPIVVERLAQRGIGVVESAAEVECGTVIVRTHGVDPEVTAAARDRGLTVIDATCPFVSVAHQKAQLLRRGRYVPLILGERDHPEVAGLLACAGARAVVVEDPAEVPESAVRGKRVGIVVQTTQTREGLSALVARVAPLAREMLVFNTICDATEKRQAEAQKLARKVDVVVVVGGRNSANTTRLASLCLALQPRTHHVEHAGELEAEWFAGARKVGVVAGASTPQEEIDAAAMRIRTLVG